jgi:hypothetical protein
MRVLSPPHLGVGLTWVVSVDPHYRSLPVELSESVDVEWLEPKGGKSINWNQMYMEPNESVRKAISAVLKQLAAIVVAA